MQQAMHAINIFISFVFNIFLFRLYKRPLLDKIGCHKPVRCHLWGNYSQRDALGVR